MKKDILKNIGIFKFVEKYKYIAVIIVVGVFLLITPSGDKTDKEKSEKGLDFDLERFEKRIETYLAECGGVGRCRVMLSIESGQESVYEKEARKSARENENGVMLESDSDIKPSVVSEGSGRERALVVKEVYPSFRGAVIMCDGADRTEVRRSIIESVAVLTGLGSDKISIIKMKK